ncbi:MAG: hypothetical protein RR512_04785 [Coprobacillus sp.]
MQTYNINLNIHYSAPQEIWDKIEQLYKEMPGWNDFIDGCPYWYGTNDQYIEASVESSGLQFYAQLPDDQWKNWMTLFKEKATDLLGYDIGEVEDGYDFHFYE